MDEHPRGLTSEPTDGVSIDSTLSARPERPRGRRLLQAVLAVSAAIAVLAAVTARVLIWPAQGLPGKVSAIVVFAGPGNLLGRADELAREHRAPYLVASLGTPGSGNPCPPRIPGVRIVCFNPIPATTQGEAEFVGRLANLHHWKSIAVVTITPQDTRARVRLQRCFPGQVYAVGVSPTLSQTTWRYQIVYQWGALLKALIFQRRC